MINQTSFLHSLGWAVVNSLWQLALLWVIYQILTSVFKSARPAAKALLASALLMVGFIWFAYTFFDVYYNSNNHQPLSFIAGYEDTEINNWLGRSLPVASVVYLVLLFIPLMRFIRNYRYVQVIRQYGLSKPGADWRLFIARLSERMGIKKPVQVWISEWVTSPVTIGHLKPVILIPMAAINGLSTQQMEAVLLHELSHIRRYDYLLNFVLMVIRTILYFNPFAAAFVKIVEAEREKSCDEMVLQFQYDSHDYATALLTLEKVSSEQRLLILNASAANGKELLGRIEKIMGVREENKPSLRRFSALITAVFFVVAANTLFVLGKAVTGSAHNATGIAVSPIRELSTIQTPSLSEVPLRSWNANYSLAKTIADNTGSYKTPDQASVAGPASDPDIINVNYETEPVVELPEEEEAIVKQAVESSRKVLESSQWKAVEKSLAEVFSKREKEELKKALNNEISRFNWAQWENKLRLAYEKVDWEKVNVQLNDAINKLRTDSLVKVYNDAMVSLRVAQKELSGLSLNGIPDSDVTLKSLGDKQKQLQKEINRLKSVRNKKIVHL